MIARPDLQAENGVKVETRFDKLGRTERVDHLSASGGSLAIFDYGMNRAGTRETVSEVISGWPARNLVYNYDKLYRLGRERITSFVTGLRGGKITYDAAEGHGDTLGYDQVGNRRSRTVDLNLALSGFGNVTSSFDRNDRLDPDSNSSNANPNYDANGNTVTEPTLPGAYAYNFEDRLLSRTGDGLPTVTNVYDGDGNRIRKTAGGVTTHYLVDDRNLTGYAQVLEESSTLNGSPIRIYIYGDDLIAQHRKDGATWTSL